MTGSRASAAEVFRRSPAGRRRMLEQAVRVRQTVESVKVKLQHGGGISFISARDPLQYRLGKKRAHLGVWSSNL